MLASLASDCDLYNCSQYIQHESREGQRAILREQSWKCMTRVTLQWASEREHNGADLEAQKHRNEVEAGSMTSHYFVKWQRRIVNNSGSASTTGTGIATIATGISTNENCSSTSTTGTGTCTATGTVNTTGTSSNGCSASSTILFLHNHPTLFWVASTSLCSLNSGWNCCQRCIGSVLSAHCAQCRQDR